MEVSCIAWSNRLQIMFICVKLALTINGNRVYRLGETSEIRCSTELSIQSVQWLDESSRVVREGTSVRELVLNLTIAASHNNSRYTCRVSHGGFMESQSVTVRTECKIQHANNIKEISWALFF
jgi:hypothetical protein